MRIDDIHCLFRERGHLAYDGEGVTQLQHGWQSARLARRAGAGAALELAAWLHDLGHLASGLPGSPTLEGIDDGHETLGAALLRPLFGPAVATPVALHVAAKRYLAATRPGYLQLLSPDSRRSLALQGGPMARPEADAFIAQAHARDALRLRAWDDGAKQAGLHPDDAAQALEELLALMRRCVLQPA